MTNVMYFHPNQHKRVKMVVPMFEKAGIKGSVLALYTERLIFKRYH